jgi:hypothetical protein
MGGLPFLDVATYPSGSESEIEIYKGGIKATAFVAQEKSINTVVMASRGPFYLKDHWNFYLVSDQSIIDRKKVWEIGMRKTLDAFVSSKKQVIFLLDNPEINFDPRICLNRPLRILKKEEACTVPRSIFEARNKEYRDLVTSVLKDYPTVKLFDVAEYFCDNTSCKARIDGKILYGDYDHLSYDGAKLVSKGLVRTIVGTDKSTH